MEDINEPWAKKYLDIDWGGRVKGVTRRIQVLTTVESVNDLLGMFGVFNS